MFRKLGWTRPHPKQHHPVPQGPPFTSIDWSPLEQSIQLPQGQNTHNSFTAVLPHRPHKSSPHFLCGRSNTTPLKPHPLYTIVASRTVLSVYTASLTDMPSPLTSCHAHGSIWRGPKVTPNRGHAHPSPGSDLSLHRRSTGSRPTGGNKTCITHRHTAHSAGDTPTS
jgi:hypothetical protein